MSWFSDIPVQRPSAHVHDNVQHDAGKLPTGCVVLCVISLYGPRFSTEFCAVMCLQHAVPRILLVGSGLIWSDSVKVNWLNKKNKHSTIQYPLFSMHRGT